MESFADRENIKRYKKLLQEDLAPERRAVIEELLREAEQRQAQRDLKFPSTDPA